MPRKTYTEQDKQLILKYAERGVSDTEIHRLTGFTYSVIQQLTTNFWKQRMNENNKD